MVKIMKIVKTRKMILILKLREYYQKKKIIIKKGTFAIIKKDNNNNIDNINDSKLSTLDQHDYKCSNEIMMLKRRKTVYSKLIWYTKGHKTINVMYITLFLKTW